MRYNNLPIMLLNCERSGMGKSVVLSNLWPMSMGVEVDLAPKRFIFSKRSRQYLRWFKVMSVYDLAISNPRKYLKYQMFLMLDFFSKRCLMEVISDKSIPARIKSSTYTKIVVK